jgi:hypothetical protein
MAVTEMATVMSMPTVTAMVMETETETGMGMVIATEMATEMATEIVTLTVGSMRRSLHHCVYVERRGAGAQGPRRSFCLLL